MVDGLDMPDMDGGGFPDPPGWAQKNPWTRFVERVREWPMRPRMYTARGIGEIASMAAAPAAAVIVDQTLHTPYEDLKQRISRAFVEPNLASFDRYLAQAKSFEPPHERKERMQLSPPEQAKRITDLFVDQFGVKFGASLIAQFLTQDYFIHKFNAGVSPRLNMISVGVDRAVQLGSAVALNTVASDQAVGMQNALIKVFQRAGMEEEKAEEWANYAVNFSVPNALAYLVSAEMLTRMAARGK